MRYFIGNWKMFGTPKSIKIIKNINNFVQKDKKKNSYRAIIAPPFTLLHDFSKFFSQKKIGIAAQNCFHKDGFSSDTGSISALMIRNLGIKNIIIGHSDNRAQGDDNKILSLKINHALSNNLKIIFCIGENLKEKKLKKTKKVIQHQLKTVLSNDKIDKKKIIVAYEPIWSIGTGLIPNNKDLLGTIKHIKKVLNSIFKSKKVPPVLYGGSVDETSVKQFKLIKEIDGFLIGGASKSDKKFIDIIKNYYR